MLHCSMSGRQVPRSVLNRADTCCLENTKDAEGHCERYYVGGAGLDPPYLYVAMA